MTFTNHLGRKDKRFDIKGPAAVWIRALEVYVTFDQREHNLNGMKWDN